MPKEWLIKSNDSPEKAELQFNFALHLQAFGMDQSKKMSFTNSQLKAKSTFLLKIIIGSRYLDRGATGKTKKIHLRYKIVS